jgi:hypothetical protein
MAYILNLVLGCWVSSLSGEISQFSNVLSKDALKNYTNGWNNYPNRWEIIHYPCKPEHFEVYEKLPENWRTYDKTEIS